MKQNKELVSIVVPVYNVESFLAECLDSLLAQTYKNLEIILVNDGSTDSSSAICDHYAIVDARIKVIHQMNGGVSSARNTGIDAATGEYITFIDADDTINSNYVKYLHGDIIEHQATTVTTATKDVTGSMQEILAKPTQPADIIVLSREDTIRELYRGTLEGTRNGIQMFSLGILNENNIRYNPNMAVGEDFDFFARAILVSNLIVVDRRELYYYRSNPASIMMQEFNEKHFDAIKNVENVGRALEGEISGLKKAIDTMLFSDAIYYGAKVIDIRHLWKKEYKEIAYSIKKYRLMVLRNNQAKLNTRLKALIVTVLGIYLGLKIMRGLIRW